MDDALALLITYINSINFRFVLILVVMDDALAPYKEFLGIMPIGMS